MDRKLPAESLVASSWKSWTDESCCEDTETGFRLCSRTKDEGIILRGVTQIRLLKLQMSNCHELFEFSVCSTAFIWNFGRRYPGGGRHWYCPVRAHNVWSGLARTLGRIRIHGSARRSRPQKQIGLFLPHVLLGAGIPWCECNWWRKVSPNVFFSG